MKYDFTQYVTKDSVMSLDGRNKLEVMDQLITRAADLTKLNRDVIFRLTWKREQMMTTGVGGMLALPHIRVNDINHPYVIVGVCENPIEDYQSQDDQPVRMRIRRPTFSCSAASPASCATRRLSRNWSMRPAIRPRFSISSTGTK